jgi:hypothetical protein
MALTATNRIMGTHDAPLCQITSPHRPSDRPQPQFAPHVERLLELLREGRTWPQKDWDEATDTVAYGRQLIGLTKEQSREAYYRLRERHTFRPSVAEVRVVVDELLPKDPLKGLSGADVAMRSVVAMPRALPSAANGPERQRAREEMERKRRGLRDPLPVHRAEKRESSAPLTGMIVMARVNGQSVRGIVWREEGDRAQVKLPSGELIWLETIALRVEETRNGQEGR